MEYMPTTFSDDCFTQHPDPVVETGILCVRVREWEASVDTVITRMRMYTRRVAHWRHD